jgi:hypothetical protein
VTKALTGGGLLSLVDELRPPRDRPCGHDRLRGPRAGKKGSVGFGTL